MNFLGFSGRTTDTFGTYSGGDKKSRWPGERPCPSVGAYFFQNIETTSRNIGRIEVEDGIAFHLLP